MAEKLASVELINPTPQQARGIHRVYLPGMADNPVEFINGTAEVAPNTADLLEERKVARRTAARSQEVK